MVSRTGRRRANSAAPRILPAVRQLSAGPAVAIRYGAHPDVVPHLTIGQGQPEDLLESAARAIEPRLPVIATVRSAVVMQGSLQPGTWHVIADLPLGAM